VLRQGGRFEQKIAKGAKVQGREAEIKSKIMSMSRREAGEAASQGGAWKGAGEIGFRRLFGQSWDPCLRLRSGQALAGSIRMTRQKRGGPSRREMGGWMEKEGEKA
jgi:hypothetical protein